MKLWMILPLTALLAACGGVDQSTTNDIAIPGSPDNENILVWTEGTSIHVGDCEAGQLATRDNCATRSGLSYATIKQSNEQRYTADYETIEEDRANEVTRLKDRHATIVDLDRQIADLETELTNKTDRLDNRNTQLVAIQDELDNNIQPRLDDYAAQLRQVFQRLIDDPDNTMLLQLRDTLEAEKAPLDQEKAEYLASKAEVEEEISTLTTQIADLEVSLTEKKAEREETYIALEVESAVTRQLDTKKAQLESYQAATPAVLELIEDQMLSYRSSMLSAEQVEALKRLVATYESVRTGTEPPVETSFAIQLWDSENGSGDYGSFTITAIEGDYDDLKAKILAGLQSISNSNVENTDGVTVNGTLYDITSSPSYTRDRLAETIARRLAN